MSIAHYNGKISPINEVSIPLTDRCVFFGDGIYDAAMGRCGRIYLEDEHIERFITNAKRLDIPLQFDKGELRELLYELIRQSGEELFFLYFQLTRYGEVRKHAYAKGERSNLLITVTPLAMPDPNRRLTLVSYPDRRYGYCNIKTLNLLQPFLHRAMPREWGRTRRCFTAATR
jgi:D-alanine transaminase